MSAPLPPSYRALEHEREARKGEVPYDRRKAAALPPPSPRVLPGVQTERGQR